MAQVDKTIGSSGKDYANAASWESAIPADQAVGDPWVGEIQEAYNAGLLQANVSNVNGAPHRLTVGSAYRHIESSNYTKGAAGTDLNAMQSMTKDFAHIEYSAGGTIAVIITCPNFIVEHLWIEQGRANTSSRLVQVGAADVTIRYCIGVKVAGNAILFYANSSGDDCIIHDCILFSIGHGSNSIRFDGDNCKAGHITAIGDGSRPREIDVVGGTGNTIDNSMIFDHYLSRFSATRTEWGGDYNAADAADGTTGAPGANSWHGLTPTDVIESDSPNIDPRMTATAAATYQGADLSATFGTVDIEGTTRTNFTVGAIEVLPALTAEPDFISSGSSTFAPTAVPGAVTAEPDFISSGSAAYDPEATLVQTAEPDFIPSGSSAFDPSASPGAVTAEPDFIPSGSVPLAPTAVPGAVTAEPDFIPSGSAPFDPSAQPQVVAEPDFIPSGSTPFDPTANIGLTANPDFIASGSTVFDPEAIVGQTADVDFIPSASVPLAPTAVPGAVTAEPDFISSGSTPFDPSATVSLTAEVDFVVSGSSVFAPGAVPGSVTASPDFISSGSLPLPPVAVPGAVTAGPGFIPSGSLTFDPIAVTSDEGASVVRVEDGFSIAVAEGYDTQVRDGYTTRSEGGFSIRLQDDRVPRLDA